MGVGHCVGQGLAKGLLHGMGDFGPNTLLGAARIDIDIDATAAKALAEHGAVTWIDDFAAS